MTQNFNFEGDAISGTPGPNASAVAGSCAEQQTWLSQDEWATIIGLNPIHFNGLASTLFGNNVCGEGFFEHSWQNADRVGREDIRMAIKQAEMQIAAEVGYNLMPDWTIAERLAYPQPMFAEAVGYGGGNMRGLYKSIEAPRGWLLSGGVRTKAVIQAGVAVTRSDVDSDQFQETCRVTANVDFTDTNLVHLYYPGKSGDDCYEIRPIKVAISGGVATIEFKIWQIVAANQKDRLDVEVLDAADPASYETTVDVYKVYNDPSTQAQFLWEGGGCGSCTACQLGTQTGCFHLRDARLGFLAPSPGTWDSADEEFDYAEWSACREPDQIRLWYYSGFVDWRSPRPYAELSPYWKYAVAYYAASLLDRPVCGCSNVNQFIEKWRVDLLYADENNGYTVTPDFAANRLGTTTGALYAYRRIHQNGVRINK